jgi:hypothetical protein
VAPADLRPALRRQRVAQRAFIAADTDAERTRTYNAAVRNGRMISDYQTENCF